VNFPQTRASQFHVIGNVGCPRSRVALGAQRGREATAGGVFGGRAPGHVSSLRGYSPTVDGILLVRIALAKKTKVPLTSGHLGAPCRAATNGLAFHAEDLCNVVLYASRKLNIDSGALPRQ